MAGKFLPHFKEAVGGGDWVAARIKKTSYMQKKKKSKKKKKNLKSSRKGAASFASVPCCGFAVDGGDLPHQA